MRPTNVCALVSAVAGTYGISLLGIWVTGRLPRSNVVRQIYINHGKPYIHPLDAGETDGTLTVFLMLKCPEEVAGFELIRQEARRFVAEWVFEVSLYWLDLLQDVLVIESMYNDGYYVFFYIGISAMLIPPIIVWLFLRSFSMARLRDLPLNVSQIGYVWDTLNSLLNGKKGNTAFWQSAGEGGFEGPTQMVLQVYKVILFGSGGRALQFLASIGTSLLSSSNAFAKMDLYGKGFGIFSKQHFKQVAIRMSDLAPNLLGLAMFAVLTRPHDLGRHANGQVIVFVFISIEVLMLFAIIRKHAQTYPLGVQVFFATLGLIAYPPELLPSLQSSRSACTLLRGVAFATMIIVGLWLSPPNSGQMMLLLRPTSFPLLVAVVVGLLAWAIISLRTAINADTQYSKVANEDQESDILNQKVLEGDNVGINDDRKLDLALHEAAKSGDAVMAQLLLLEGADPNGMLRDPDDGYIKAPLHSCARNGHLLCADVLLRSGADVNQIEKFVSGNPGNTPLAWAVDAEHFSLAELLIDRRADANMKCEQEKTALVWCREQNKDAAADFLLRHGAQE